jgi:Family of unknown function (DUF6496)
MAKQSRPQKKTMERVMHEYKHGELKSGPRGRGGKVKNRRQAIAIALHEAGASKYESRKENERNLRRTKRKERQGQTALAEKEGRKQLPDRRRKTGARKGSGRSTASRRTPSSRKTASGRKSSTPRKSAAARSRSTSRKRSGGKSKSRS